MTKKQKVGRPGRHGAHAARAGTARRRWLPWAALALVLAGAAAAILLLSRPGSAGIAEVTPAQAYAKLEAGAYVLDVRTEAEYVQAHIAGSVLIPLDELANRLDEVPHDRDVLVICRSGARSREGAAILQKAGFTRLSCLGGGLLAWVDAGYAVEQGQ